MVRSHHAHGRIRRIDARRALALPGVLAVYTGADLAAAGYGAMVCKLPLKNADGSPLFAPPRPIFATERVRHVGEPVAAVIAEDPHAARDAALLVEVDVEPLPAVSDPEAAMSEAAPRLHGDHPNLCLDWRFGDHEAAERAMAAAAHVARVRLVSNRVVVAAMEPRAAVAEYDGTSERFTLHVGCQGVFGLRRALAEDLLKIAPERLRVRAYSVGGSFGMKAAAYPEYVAILHAARALARPVKWCDERSDSFLSDHQGRGTIVDAELALVWRRLGRWIEREPGIWERADWDLARRVLTLAVRGESGETAMQLAWRSPEEWRALLERARFEVEAMYGWFDLRPYGGGEDTVWIARRPAV